MSISGSGGAELEIRARIVQAAWSAIASVRARRLQDLVVLREAWADSRETGMTVDSARTALGDLKTHVAGVATEVGVFGGQGYRTWNQHWVPEEESHYGQWLNRQVVGYATRYEPQILAWVREFGNPSQTLGRLFQVAADATVFEDSLADGPDGLSSYEAKVLLFYALPLESRRRLIHRLTLRFDIRDIVPSEELARFSDAHRESAYGCSILMDGYFYGALRSNARGLLKDSVEGAFGVGIDCSTFVQETYESAGFPATAFKSPISTSSMIEGEMSGLRDGTFEVSRLVSESGLVAGDAILWPGHVQVFLGRDESGRLRIAEALGRRFKTLRESVLPLREGPGAGVSVFENPERPMYVFRPRGCFSTVSRYNE